MSLLCVGQDPLLSTQPHGRLQLIFELGGRFALSDDSHGPHRVGEHYPRMRDYLRQLGVKELWHLSRTSDGTLFQRGLSATRVAGDWEEHAFWKRCASSGQT